MKAWHLLFLLFLVAACGVTMPEGPRRAMHGGSVGNGGDDMPLSDGSAWFLGPAPIRYCALVSRDFGVSRAAALRSVERAFSLWRAYLGERNYLVEATRGPGRFNGVFPSIELNTEQLPACDGTQNLTFYFGVEDDVVRQHERPERNRLAFAERLSYDPSTGRGRGFIWVKGNGLHGPDFPRWQTEGALDTMVAHEIGHVAGCGHVEGTVMEAGIVGTLREYGSTPLRAKIDGQRVLHVPTELMRFFVDAEELIVRPLSAFRVMAPPMKSTGPFRHVDEGSVLVRNSFRNFHVFGLHEVNRHGTGMPIFKRVYRDRKSLVVRREFSTTDVVTYSGWTRENGEERPAIVEYNDSEFRMRVQLPNDSGRMEEVVRF